MTTLNPDHLRGAACAAEIYADISRAAAEDLRREAVAEKSNHRAHALRLLAEIHERAAEERRAAARIYRRAADLVEAAS